MYGFMGKMLFVDLSSGKIEERELPEQLAKDYLGGPALGARILYDEMPANTDVFGEDSMVGFLAGPTGNTPAVFGGRYTVVSKSPIYDGWNDANSGGFFGPMLKKSGYDAVFVRGISEKPVYIFIDNGKTEIRDASALWGKPIEETENLLKSEIGDTKIVASMIGPAGENLSGISAVMNDTHRAAARGGTGAVMGSKKLKAVVCRGDQKTEVGDKAKLVAANKAVSDWMHNGPMSGFIMGAFSPHGTGFSTPDNIMSGDAVTKNWTTSSDQTGIDHEVWGQFSTIALDEQYKVKPYGCATCPMRCGAIYKVEDGPWPLEETARPEYESLGTFASQVLNTDPRAMLAMNHLCNDYGLDTIAAGGTLGWVVECYNDGILTKDDVDGLDLTWGNGAAFVQLIEKIGKGEGCGKVFLLGSQGAARKLGKGEDRLVTASGIEIAQHDPKYGVGFLRTYELDPTPGRHTKGGWATFMGLPPEYKYTYSWSGFSDVCKTCSKELINMSGLCMFSEMAIIPPVRTQMLSAVLGMDITPRDEFYWGKRSWLMRHLFNWREGKRRSDWTVSPRLVGDPPLETGPLAGVTVPHEKLGDQFYTAMGLDLEGKPDMETLLLTGGLDDIMAEMYPPPPMPGGPPPEGEPGEDGPPPEGPPEA